ncbi:MAG: S8 family serine peptidase [Acidobacteria bacterium]|nr:S8 family serine peptidase [Acidobacteriota bacterium]
MIHLNPLTRTMAALCCSVFLTLAFAAEAQAGDRYLVRYEKGAKDQVLSELGADAIIHHEFDDLGVLAATLPASTVETLLGLSVVLDVAEDPIHHLFGQTVPYGIDLVHARDEWDADRDGVLDEGAATGAGVRVCITDTGIAAAHEDLRDLQILAGRSWVDEDWADDRQGHGTHVAGTVAAMHNDLGVVGVSPGTVELLIADVFNDAGEGQYSSTILDAARWCADQGADIISMSLGGKIGLLSDGYQAIYDRGVLIVAAAGNDGVLVFNYPAGYESVASVAAIDASEEVASFSTYNTDVEVAAPGVAVRSTYPHSSSLVVSGGPRYEANPIANADPDNTSITGALADGGDCNTTPGSADQWAGQVVLCERGGATFRSKIDNVAAGGGAAAVIYNNTEGNFNGTYGDPCCSAIPAVSLSQADGHDALAFVGGEGTVNVKQIVTNAYASLSGTSMATPHASAAAAVIWSACPSLSHDQVRAHLSATTRESQADLLAGRDAFYGFGIVQVKEGVDALSDGINEYDPSTGNGDGNSPANVECSVAAGAKANGGGWLHGIDGRLNFGFDVEATSSGGAGSLSLNDHGRELRISMSQILSVSPLDSDCGTVPAGSNSVEIVGEGSFDAQPASFRACVADAGEPGAGGDRFYLECTSGCAYDTAQSAVDAAIDGGNIDVETTGTSDSSGSSSTVVLDPVLLDEGVAGTLQVFTARVYDGARKLMDGATVTVVQRTADGGTSSFEAVTDSSGEALLTLTLPLGSAEYQAVTGTTESNFVEVDSE